MGLSDAASDFILLFILKIFMDVSFSLSMCAVVCACAPVLSPEDDIGGLISHGLPIPLRKILSLNLGLVFFFRMGRILLPLPPHLLPTGVTGVCGCLAF